MDGSGKIQWGDLSVLAKAIVVFVSAFLAAVAALLGALAVEVLIVCMKSLWEML